MKRFFLLALVGTIILAIAMLGYTIVRGNAEKEATARRIHTLPEFRFTTLNGAAFTPAQVSPEKSLVIIHFLPDCPLLSGREATELVAHAPLFSNAHILMVSASDMRSLRAFGNVITSAIWAHLRLLSTAFARSDARSAR
jgi:hypothetical protein